MIGYNINDYERPSVAVDSVVFSIKSVEGETFRDDATLKLAVLLIKRGEEPFKSKYALPGGFLRPNETIENALARELHEETGITNASLIPLANYSNPGRDPRGWIISCASMALIPECAVQTLSGSDAESSDWFEVKYSANGKEEIITLKSDNEELVLKYSEGKAQPSQMAFDHSQIIYDAYKKLQELTLNINIVFNLLPEMFKISEMQAIYETILNKKETKSNFRRKMMNYIEETGKTTSDEGHRPSQLYKRR